MVPALYASARTDTQPFTLLHPDRLREQGADVAAPNLFVYSDLDVPNEEGDASLSFSDDRTQIETADQVAVTVGDLPAHLLAVSLNSSELSDRTVAVLRIKTPNRSLAEAAEAEGWRPPWFVGICDGCGGFGGNAICENSFLDFDHPAPLEPIPLRLGCRYWVSDHFFGSDALKHREGGEEDLPDGGLVTPSDPRFEVGLRQIVRIGAGWRSKCRNDDRTFGGARLFEIERR